MNTNPRKAELKQLIKNYELLLKDALAPGSLRRELETRMREHELELHRIREAELNEELSKGGAGHG